MPHRCCVPHCENRSLLKIDKNVKFYRIPAIITYRESIIADNLKKHQLSIIRQRKWIESIQRKDYVEYPYKIKHARVCSKHFISGKPAKLTKDTDPDWIPTLFIHSPNTFIEEIRTVEFKFRGLMAPVFTAFNENLTLNTFIVSEYAKYLRKVGISGVLVLGTTGEFSSVSIEERKKLAEAWMAASKSTKLHVMIQVGGVPLPHIKELAAHAEKIGANSILTLPELYIKPKTSQDLIEYLKIIASAAPDTPLLYYHIPSWSGVNINMEEFLNYAVDKIPTFSGIKYTSNDLAEGYNALNAADRKYAVFLGADTLVQPALALGFDSVIATGINIFPQYFIEIQKLMKANKIEESRQIQEKLTKAINIITRNGSWVPTMKVAMNLFNNLINVGSVRAPSTNISEDHSLEMKLELEQFYKIDPEKTKFYVVQLMASE